MVLAAYFAVAILVALFFSSLPVLLLVPAFATVAIPVLLNFMQPSPLLVVWSVARSGAQSARYLAWQRIPGGQLVGLHAQQLRVDEQLVGVRRAFRRRAGQRDQHPVGTLQPAAGEPRRVPSFLGLHSGADADCGKPDPFGWIGKL